MLKALTSLMFTSLPLGLSPMLMLFTMLKSSKKSPTCAKLFSPLLNFSLKLPLVIFSFVTSPLLLLPADIRRGGWTNELDNIIDNVANSNLNLQVLELQDESIDDLLNLIRPLCANSRKAPIVCLDYLQIVPHNKDNIKLGIDDSVRKLKKFQRDTNTTFIVISSFNRTNYNQSVSFESFKESGGIEYSADVVWALQLYIMNQIKGGSDISQTRKKIDYAKKQQPRHIHLKCLKNRQGSNYDCFFQYFSAHDYFMPCNEDDFQTEEKDDF